MSDQRADGEVAALGAGADDVPPERPRRVRLREPGRIVFVGLLITFVSVLMYVAFDLRPRVRTMPLLVGLPSLGALVLVLLRETIIGVRPGPSPDRRSAGEDGAAHRSATSIGGMAQAAREEIAKDNDLGGDARERRRQAWFTVWTLGFFLLASFTSYRLAVPLSLMVILVATGVGWVKSALITVGTSAGLYALFIFVLSVRL